MDYAHGKGRNNNLEATSKEAEAVELSRYTNSGSFSSSDSSIESAEMDILTDLKSKLSSIKLHPEGSGDALIANMQGASQTQPAGYDPNRIPLAIFSSKPTTPMEWSVTSNESLFSLHIGNGSFSRDNFLLMNKSGELGRLDESISSLASLPHVSDIMNSDRKSGDKDRVSGVSTESNETPKAILRINSEHHNKEKWAPAEEDRKSTSVSGYTDESGNSTRSFEFPVLESDHGRNNSPKVHLQTESQRQSTRKLDSQKLPQTPVATPKAAGKSWFSCFSCCPLCS